MPAMYARQRQPEQQQMKGGNDLNPLNPLKQTVNFLKHPGGSSTPAPPVPIPSAAPTANNAASLQAEQALYRQQLRRKGVSGTIYAGANPSGGGSNPGYTGAAPSAASPTGKTG